MFKRLDHVGIIVDDLEEAKGFVTAAFGLQLDRELDLPERGVKAAFFQCGEAQIELVEVTDPESRKERLGDGNQARVEHVAIQVENLQEALTSLEKLGVRPTSPEPTRLGNDQHAWTQASTSRGVMYQFIEKG
jgi:methylmalonyl-CoA/ethylmalonyl-CoA epimerase